MSGGETHPDEDDDQRHLRSLVGDLATFAAEHWGTAPVHRSTGEDFTRVLGVEDVERILASGARVPTFRLVREGVTLPPKESTRPVRLGGRRVEDVADLGRIADAVGQGATVVLQSLQRTHPPLTDLCRSLERAISHPVQANAYLSPPTATGLSSHRDDHDVIVLHVWGTKTWEVDGLGTVVLEPGDVLYLPVGTEHRASTSEGPSLHVTLGIISVTRADVLRRLLDRPAADLRAPLPLGYARPDGHDALIADLAAALDDLGAVVAAADPAELAAGEQRRAEGRRTPVRSGHLRAVLSLDEVGAATLVERRPHHPAELESEPAPDGRIRLSLPGRTMDLPADLRPAVLRLLTGEPVRAADLPDLDAASGVVLVRRLVREGLLVPTESGS